MNQGKPPIVVADDDELVLLMMEQHLRQWEHRPVLAPNKARLLEILDQERAALVLMDIRFGSHDGVEIMRELLQRDPDLIVVIMTAFGTIDNAVAAIKLGAYDFLTKPPDLARLQLILNHALEKHRLSQKLQRLEQLFHGQQIQKRILGESEPMIRLREMIASLASTDLTVLIQAESGTGKELVANALHWQSNRRNGPLVPVNMAALPGELAESILFGHVRGAFTGADRDNVGCCEAANGGTLFLDEIGEMDMNLQAKLLRFLQERTLQRVGDTRPIPVDTRIVAATNADLAEQIKRGKFREDLYYRLNVVPLRIPPLRERSEDIPLLAEFFLNQAAQRYKKSVRGFTPAALDRLMNYPWPGNVRELQNLVERLAVFSRGAEVDVGDLPVDIGAPPVPSPAISSLPPNPPPAIAMNGDERPHTPEPSRGFNQPQTFEELERKAIIDAINAANGQISRAASMLGIGKATLYRKIKRYNIAPQGGRIWASEAE